MPPPQVDPGPPSSQFGFPSVGQSLSLTFFHFVSSPRLPCPSEGVRSGRCFSRLRFCITPGSCLKSI